VLILFTLTVLTSAALLFLVQPMFARMVLPLLGGSPAVWNTALVFYQVTLLAGYAYAHYASAWLGRRRHTWLHLAIVLLAFASLPIAVPRGWSPPVATSPVPWMLALLAVGIGLPFFVVSTTGPLVQKWFAATPHRAARDPYFLYAAGNAGSMAGLLGYLLLLEPRLTLGQQSTLWTAGYGVLAVLLAACAWAGRRTPNVAAAVAAGAAGEAGAAGAAPADRSSEMRRRALWVLLAFVPSSLMLGVTNHIGTDIAAIPLLWVIPLAIYLLSMILVFASRPPIPHRLMVRALSLVMLPLLVVILSRAGQPLALVVGLHLLALFVAAMVCHGELAADRPPPDRLTEFYLWMAVGGALGGAFNALLAPVVFRTVVEYPIAIVLACLMTPARASRRSTDAPASSRARVMDVVAPAVLGLAVIACIRVPQLLGRPLAPAVVVLLIAALVFPLYAFARRPLRFALGVAAVLLANPASLAERSRMLFEDRDFFGVNRVVVDANGRFAELLHGTTLHGVQRIRPLECREPLGYYHRRGPLADVFADSLPPHAAVAVAGLGAGGTAAYARAGERWTFYEIDPMVRRIATDSTLFCFLSDCPAATGIVLGDARRSLADSNDRYDIVLLDAYTSDAIPVHLITREALRVYLEHLRPHGRIVMHVSNRYFDLVPVVARLAADAGLPCRVRTAEAFTTRQITEERIVPSTWAVVARATSDLGSVGADPRWHAPVVGTHVRVWTDDYSSLLSVLRR
jgi:spermidine synthase